MSDEAGNAELSAPADGAQSGSGNEMLDAFLSEVSEILGNLETAIIELEKVPADMDKINSCFRFFHNMKGSSAMMECFIIKEISHFSESLLALARNKQMTINSGHVDLFLKALAALKDVVAKLKSTGKEGDERYFGLLQSIVDAIATGSGQQAAPSEIAASEEKKAKKDDKKNDADLVRVSRSTIEQMMLLVGEFMQLKNKIQWLKSRYRDPEYQDNCVELDQFSGKFQRNVLKLRLSPVRPIFDSMRRVVRTTANQVNKKIEFEISGEETLLDRSILDIIGDPLMHLLRNAIDHGVESEEKRIENNKPAAGHVHLKAVYRAGEVHISIADDGGGIDAAKIKRKAIEKGVITEAQAANMSQQEAIHIIFLPGFSGAEKVTETSGRGVGMDVVKEAIHGVGGQVDIQTEVGHGTTFVIKLPLSLAIVECLGFRVGGQTYAIPQVNVEEVLSIRSSTVQENVKTLESGSRVLIVRDSPAPILPLAEILDQEQGRSEALIQVRHSNFRFVLEVGEVLGPISIVSQALPPSFADDAPFSGVTKQGDGSLLFQLDVSRLFKHIESKTTRVQKTKSENRGAAGLSQENSLLNSSDVRRLQQKTIVFKNGLHFCLPVQRVKRIVFVNKNDIKEIGTGRKSFVTLEGNTIPLVWVEELLLRQKRIRKETYSLLILQQGDSTFGIPMVEFLGIERLPNAYETEVAEDGILGSTVINGNTCLAIDMPAVVALYHGEKANKQEADNKDGTRKRRILCAEDDKFFSSELRATLSGANYEVIMCEDGLFAKEKLSDPEFVKTIDLIVSDIEMPRMTGLALCRWLKSNEPTKEIPVVAYTAITTDEMRRRMLAAGAHDFISKMCFDDLLVSIRKILNGEQTSLQEEAAESKILKTDRIVTFQIGQGWYGLPMEHIKEVSPVTSTGNIPKTDVWLQKVTSFRGAMVPVLDLQKFFGLETAGHTSEQAVVEVSGVTFALRVARIGEVIIKSQLSSGDGLPSLSEDEHLITKYVSGVYRYNDLIISLVSPDALASICVKDKKEMKTGEKAA